MASDPPSRDNVPVFTVSEIGSAVKRTLEGTFERVRIRGEISRPSFPSSGHCYFRLKDETAVIDAVVWRGVRTKLRLQPEDGLEVIATGKLTAYAGKSSYQIMVDALEIAGEGALLKLLEERRRKLAAEGLFADESKRALPYLPEVVGVVTSPTGAVIRDILHRLAERFPRRVLVWPVSVQGDKAAPEVAAAIRGFNALPAAGPVPRPQVLIVARGGGSLEDLWAFNEEEVVRAAAASAIPLISAVGHETDTTLIDFAADRRAPTPTAAAEIAVPVRSELTARIADLAGRLTSAGVRGLDRRRGDVAGLARGLPDPRRLVQEKGQRLDDTGERLDLAMRRLLRQHGETVTGLGHRLPHPRQQIRLARERLETRVGQLDQAMARRAEKAREAELRLDAGRRMDQGLAAIRRQARERLEALGRILDGYSYRKTLERGFAVVHRQSDDVATAAADVAAGDAVRIEWHDGDQPAVIGVRGSPRKRPRDATSEPQPRRQRQLL
jgi:exodeoxyribonuclease VII large subunit